MLGWKEKLANKAPILEVEDAVEEDMTKDTATEDREKILTNGWYQGAIISCADGDQEVLGLPAGECDAYVIVSHSCDILAFKYKTEPRVEFIGGNYSRKANKSFVHRRHPRKLLLNVQNNELGFITLDINIRHFVNRTFLTDIQASEATLSSESITELQMWMAARYRRSAFPDAFNDRIRSAIEIIQGRLEAEGDHGVRGLYIQLDTYEELNNYQEYSVSLLGTAEDDLGDVTGEKWGDAEEFVEFIANELKKCKGVIVIGPVELVDEENLTLARLKRLRLLTFDYISHRDDKEVPELA